MLNVIPHILNAEQLLHCQALLQHANWEDGKNTAGVQSGAVKHNEQIQQGDLLHQLQQLVLSALAESAAFISAALPKQIFPPLVNRYQGGGHFGVHVDNAIRAIPGTSERIRTDLSCTLFLNDPESYDGGILTIEDQYGAQEVKLPAGSLVLYPSTSLHYVTPVTRGARICAFFWLQSLIRCNTQRAHLYDMDQTIQSLSNDLGGNDARVVQLTGQYHNLVRMWAEM